MYSSTLPEGYESAKCRYRIIKYLRGLGLDIGCGHERISPYAIGIDYGGAAANINIDLSAPNALKIFSDNYFDYVFSSHVLEDFYDTKGILKEWWRVIKPGGYMILYIPHKYFYPNVGEPLANANHKHDFVPEDIINIMSGFASYNMISNKTYSDKDEYSFELIFQKINAYNGQIIVPGNNGGAKKVKDKSAIVIRYGGVGDLIMITPLVKLLNRDGYHTVVNTVPKSAFVLENNPYIDEIIPQDNDTIPNLSLDRYFKELGKGFDKVINLCESVERTMLKEPRDRDFYYSKEELDKRLTEINYYDRTLEIGGYKETGLNGEIYLSPNEEALCNVFKAKNKDFFMLMWCLKGSSPHKFCVDSEEIINHLLDKYPFVKVFMVAGNDTKIMAWNRDRLENRIGMWDLRTSIIMPKYMDMVVAPETGVLNAAGCFDTPKLGLLTHSSKTNLTKYFKNDYSIQSGAKCSPCHKMIHHKELCLFDDKYGVPVCTTKFDKDIIIARIESVIQHWQSNNRS